MNLMKIWNAIKLLYLTAVFENEHPWPYAVRHDTAGHCYGRIADPGPGFLRSIHFQFWAFQQTTGKEQLEDVAL